MNRVFAAPSADPSRSSVWCRFCKQLEITELIRMKLIKTPTTKEPERVKCDLGERGGAVERWRQGLDWLSAQSPPGRARSRRAGR